MLKVKFHDDLETELLKFVVIVSKYNGKWVFCKHKERDTFECPGGHIEKGETFGMLYYADISTFGTLPDLEIEKILLFDTPPTNLTYPQIIPSLLKKTNDILTTNAVN